MSDSNGRQNDNLRTSLEHIEQKIDVIQQGIIKALTILTDQLRNLTEAVNLLQEHDREDDDDAGEEWKEGGGYL